MCACLTLAGCASRRQSADGASRGSSSSAIVEINLLAMPLALNLDQSPGADGFAVKIYPVTRGDAKTQPIRSGQLEILIFDGVLPGPVSETNEARRVWRYTDADLPAYLFRSTIGAGYAFTPRWERDAPRQDKITVVARYTSPRGPTIYSAPSVITVVSE